jgi:hypothetical protein
LVLLLPVTVFIAFPLEVGVEWGRSNSRVAEQL